MVSSKAKTVTEYLAALPAAQRTELAKVRELVREHLPEGYEEHMQYGMISWIIPLARYPKTYNKQPLAMASLAAQKNHLALYLSCIYSSEADRKRFEVSYAKSGKKLDMGKACLRFKHADELATDVIGAAIARASVERFIAAYEATRA
jgi:uncharacterized protein YdhG (YjbR/CyaY superfamily)